MQSRTLNQIMTLEYFFSLVTEKPRTLNHKFRAGGGFRVPQRHSVVFGFRG